MIAYIDSSVLMRIVLGEPNALEEWPELFGGISSVLLVVEGFRTFDRLWHRNELSEDELAAKQHAFRTFLRRMDLRTLDQNVLDAAAQPLPTPLTTLDAIHLATAILARAAQPDHERPIVFATHDRQLAAAARAVNFEVIGA